MHRVTIKSHAGDWTFRVLPEYRLYLIDVSNMPWARPDLEFLFSKIPFAVEKGYPCRLI